MGFKCSMLGHAFGDPEPEREREERGGEVVTTIREVAHCTRCDETKVVSESKEVTAIVEPDGVTAEESESDGFAGVVGRTDDGTTDDSTAEPAADSAPETHGRPDEADAVGEDGFDLPAGESPVDTEEPIADDIVDRDPDEEDTEILDDDEGGNDRTPGQWPDDDEPWKPDASADEAADGDRTADAESAVSEVTTDEPPAVGTEATTGDDTLLVPEGTYACPECGFTTEVDGSSLRAGDACPQCQRGYLEGERNS